MTLCFTSQFSQSEAVLAFFDLSAGDQVFRRQDWTETQEGVQVSTPQEDLTFRPEEDQTLGPEEDQTFRPEEDQTSRPEKDQTFRPEEDQTFRLKKDQTRGPDEEETIIPEQTQIFRVCEDQDVNVFQSSVVCSGQYCYCVQYT